MGHTAPDWGIAGTTATIYRVDDLGELAARLWSPSTYDRSGNVIWMDDFVKYLNRWSKIGTGTGHDAYIDGDLAHHGDHSCKLITGDATGNYEYILHYHPEPKLSKVGIEWWWTLTEGADEQYMYWVLKVAGKTCTVKLRFLYADELWSIEYANDAGGWTELAAGLDYRTGSTMFHANKLVADLVDEQYVRLSIDGTDYDMSDIPIYTDTGETQGWMSVQIGIVTAGDSNLSMWVDSVILTQNEP